MAEGFPKQIPPKDFGRYLGGITIRGPQGPQGKFGPQGLQGAQGLQGLPGEYAGVGAQGPQGSAGAQGPQGTTGVQGTQGISSLQVLQRTYEATPAVPGTADTGSFYITTSGGSTVEHIVFFGINYTNPSAVVQEALLEAIGVGQYLTLSHPSGQTIAVYEVTGIDPGSAVDIGFNVSVITHDGSTVTDEQTYVLDVGSKLGPQGSQGPQGATGSQGPAGVQGAQGAQGASGAQGAAGAGYGGTSASNHSLTIGSKIFTTQAGLAYQIGTRVRLTATADPSAFVEGAVSNYTGTSLTVSVDYFEGTPAANFASWRLSVAGEVGYQGAAGTQGPQGTTGSQGPQGDDGTQGPPGSGAQGAQGDTGSQGPQGNNGTTGPQGAQGDTGAQGATGAQGPQGNVGSTGSQGAQGAAGAQGAQGATGTQGAQGVAGAGYDTTSNTPLTLATGSKSFVIGTNKAYSEGDRVVLKSDTDPNNQMTGLVTSYTVGTGAMDVTVDAFQGSGGPYNDWLVSLGGAPGPQGNDGVQGVQGAQGPQGDTGVQGATYGGTSTTNETLDVGLRTLTIETGKAYQAGDRVRAAYTSSPSDTYMEGNIDSYTTGTGVLVFTADVAEGTVQAYANWVVSLTGVRGAQGPQGTQGTQGTQGVQGTQGDTGLQGPQGTQGVQGAQSAFYGGTSTTSNQIGLGARSLTTQTNLAWTIGSRVRTYSTGSGELNEGVVTSYVPGTGVLDFTSDRYVGVLGTPHTDWSLSLIGDQGAQGPQGSQGTQGTQGPQAAQLPLASDVYQRTAASSTTSDFYAQVNGDAEITLTLAETAKIFVQAEFSGGNSAEGGDVRIVVQNDSPATVFTSDEISFPASNTDRFTIQGLTGDLPAGDYTIYLEFKSDVNSNTASITQTTLFGQAQLAARGPQGTQGTQGVTGAQGATGPQGTQGTQGVTGAQGAQGAGYAGTATDSVTIGTGAKVFNTQTGLAFVANMRVRVASQGTSNRWMEGPVSSYAAGVLTVNVTSTLGSGTFSDWGISVAGEIGPQGATGPQGTQGVTGAQGPQGNTGGPQGATGPQGTQGVTGAQGPQGNTGSQGPQGDTGTQGTQGVTGAQGPQGNTGSQGPQGDTGTQGTQGTQGDLVTTQHGRTAIGNGTDTVSPTFAGSFADTNYTLVVSITNVTDSPPSDFMWKVTAKTTGGFTVVLSGNTNSANYVLEYFAIHD